MAEAAAARREARRRRILDNSQNRLQLISGKAGDNCHIESSSKTAFPDHNNEVIESTTSDSSVFCLPPVNNGVIGLEAESFDLLSTPHDSVAAGDTAIPNDLAALLAPTADSTQNQSKSSLWEKFIAYKYDIVLLALVNQFIYSLFSLETTYFFLPIILYTITKITWFPVQGKSNIANALLLLNGISASRIQKIMNALQWFSVISQDVCVYLFTTICTQSFLITLFNIFT